ncbi:MAG TPA: ribosomal-processing cysteine protease Prp [Lachnospiraceae bacterium]|nr:ribosomal-processing cysteine protease Prp [Lachnospiraceae bacterium]
MIKISFSRNAEGVYNGFKTSGHAGYADSGYDIICSAVSVLVINAINSIEQFTSDRFDMKAEENSDKIEFTILSQVSKEASLLLNSLLLGLQGIRDNYGREYIEIKA